MGNLLLVVIFLPFIVSAAFTPITFLLAWWVFPGGGSRGPHDTLASRTVGIILVVIAEWLANAWVLYLLPFGRMRSLGGRSKLQPGRVPVVLLPGFFENALTMEILRRRMERALGVPVFAMRPEGYFSRLENQAQGFARRIASVVKQTGAGQVDLVGHSMGGLLARFLAESGGLKKDIRNVVTIAAPHLGSALSRMAPGHSLRQMRRGSAFLERLNAGSTPSGVRIVGITSTHDNLVIPWNCSLSPRGDNFIIRYRGHVTLIFSREVARLIVRELE
jgi:pimeloyl-ACP methyl ester carboxylesterase